MTMTTTHPNGIAPVDRGTYRLGGKGGRMAQAWQYVWDRLDRDRWYGSMELSRDAAQAFGLKPVSVSEMLGKMRAAGVIEQTMIVASTPYTRPHMRVHCGSGDWTVPIVITAYDKRWGMEAVFAQVLPVARDLTSTKGVLIDRRDMIDHIATATALDPSEVGRALTRMVEIGVLVSKPVKVPVYFESARARVHYRIAKTAS